MRSILLALALAAAACEYVDMALPLSRNETAAPSDPVPSDTINDLQDMTIGGKHGPITKIYNPNRYQSVGVGILLTRSLGKVTGEIGNGALSAIAEIDLPVGAVITGFRLWVDPTVGNTVRGRLYATNGIAAATLLGTSNTSNALGNDEQLIGVMVNPTYTVVTGFSIVLWVDRVAGVAETDGLASFELDYYVP